MGDSRITVTLILGNDDDSSTSPLLLERHSTTLPADSTLRDVSDFLTSTVFSTPTLPPDVTLHSPSEPTTATTTTTSVSVSVYDRTYHPPKDVTPSLLHYDHTAGARSKTLFEMGWFPSGALAVVRTDDAAARDAVPRNDVHLRRVPEEEEEEEDAASNDNPASVLSEDVAAASADRPTPSQVMKTVADRLDRNRIEEGADAFDRPPPRRRRTEARRTQSLDAQLRRIDELQNKKDKKSGGRNKKTSLLVRKMLIKSRAEGDKKLRMEDRFFLQTTLVSDVGSGEGGGGGGGGGSTSYRFYSKNTTAGRIATSLANTLPPAEGRSSELLVATPTTKEDADIGGGGAGEGEATTRYGRLPNTMRLYEAEAEGLVRQFDRVVVRVFEVGVDGESDATPLVTG